VDVDVPPTTIKSNFLGASVMRTIVTRVVILPIGYNEIEYYLRFVTAEGDMLSLKVLLRFSFQFHCEEACRLLYLKVQKTGEALADGGTLDGNVSSLCEASRATRLLSPTLSSCRHDLLDVYNVGKWRALSRSSAMHERVPLRCPKMPLGSSGATLFDEEVYSSLVIAYSL
jgi:hypothetical protein